MEDTAIKTACKRTGRNDKTRLIASKEFFEYLNEHTNDVFSNDKMVCEHIANENCKIKYEVVMKDERESGLREILNLGHTVGRAIETVSDYQHT